MEFIDTHAHLDDEKFQADLPDVLERARAAGVVRIVVIATTGPSSQTCVDLAARHSFLRAAVGIQPNHVAQAAASDWDTIVALAERPGSSRFGRNRLGSLLGLHAICSAGGLLRSPSGIGARRCQRAVVIHCREAEADTVRVLRTDFERLGPVRGVMHSFTGALATAQACMEMGLYISFAGMVTYKNAKDLREVAKQVPLERLLVETDSPYLAPVPVRGKRDEPAFVVHTARCLAEVKGVPLEFIAESTTRNARTLFGLD